MTALSPQPMQDLAALTPRVAQPRRVRILHVVDNLNYGGMERLIADMVRRTDTTRFDVHVLALGYLGHFAQGLCESALHTATPMSRWSMLCPTSLARDIKAIAPDVVHVHSGVWYKASLAARKAGVERIVYTDHGRQNPDPLLHRMVDYVASRRTQTVVAVSEALSHSMADFVADRQRLCVIPNGVDTDHYVPLPDDGVLRAELQLAPNVPIIGSIGRLEQIKGYDVMLDAFALLREQWQGPNPPHLVLVGDGAERARLEAMTDTANMRGVVHFLGWRSDIENCQRAFTLFTMSSRSEGTSVSLLEAMSAGLCPVVTRVGGNPTVLGDALRHRLVPSEQPVALATAWRQALEDPDRRIADGIAARDRVVSAFSLGAMVRAYEQVYADEALVTSVPKSGH